MAVRTSLFEAPVRPPLENASGWITGTLSGDLAIALCVIAVAFVGLVLMTGRLAIRDAVRVVIGCFVLLGASVIAGGLQNVAREAAQPRAPVTPPVTAESIDPS